MKIEFRLLQEMHGYALAQGLGTTLARYARPITNERDYRESKALLARIMRTADDTESAVRAEALLREIVDYEMRQDSEFNDPPRAADIDDEYDGPHRRWSDGDDH
jgi:hypothetical protein